MQSFTHNYEWHYFEMADILSCTKRCLRDLNSVEEILKRYINYENSGCIIVESDITPMQNEVDLNYEAIDRTLSDKQEEVDQEFSDKQNGDGDCIDYGTKYRIIIDHDSECIPIPVSNFTIFKSHIEDVSSFIDYLCLADMSKWYYKNIDSTDIAYIDISYCFAIKKNIDNYSGSLSLLLPYRLDGYSMVQLKFALGDTIHELSYIAHANTSNGDMLNTLRKNLIQYFYDYFKYIYELEGDISVDVKANEFKSIK